MPKTLREKIVEALENAIIEKNCREYMRDRKLEELMESNEALTKAYADCEMFEQRLKQFDSDLK